MPTRTRAKHKTYDLRRSGYYLSSNPSFIYYASNTAFPTLQLETSIITDANGKDGRFRPCVHQKRYVSLYGSMEKELTLPLNSPHTLTAIEYPTQVAVSRGNERMDSSAYSWSSVSGFSWSGLDSDAMAQMLPSLSDGSSLANFIYELKDFKRLGKSLLRLYRVVFKNLVKALERLKAIWKAGVDVFWEALGSRPWESKPRKASAAFLAWKFAWAPFVADCKEIWAKLLSYREKVKQFERRQKQRQQRHWGKNLKVTQPNGPSNGTWSGSLGPFSWTGQSAEVSTKGEARYTATMRYRYYLTPEMLAAAKSIDGMLDVWGINGNPAIIWNAIPFSFVVDWFCSVGNYLEKIRINNVRPIVEISDFCSSVRSERVFKDTAMGKLQYSSYQKETGVFGVYLYVRYYERKVGIPSLYTFNDTLGVISGTKAALAGALVHQNLPTFEMSRGHYRGLKDLL